MAWLWLDNVVAAWAREMAAERRRGGMRVNWKSVWEEFGGDARSSGRSSTRSERMSARWWESWVLGLMSVTGVCVGVTSELGVCLVVVVLASFPCIISLLLLFLLLASTNSPVPHFIVSSYFILLSLSVALRRYSTSFPAVKLLLQRVDGDVGVLGGLGRNREKREVEE